MSRVKNQREFFRVFHASGKMDLYLLRVWGPLATLNAERSIFHRGFFSCVCENHSPLGFTSIVSTRVKLLRVGGSVTHLSTVQVSCLSIIASSITVFLVALRGEGGEVSSELSQHFLTPQTSGHGLVKAIDFGLDYRVRFPPWAGIFLHRQVCKCFVTHRAAHLFVPMVVFSQG